MGRATLRRTIRTSGVDSGNSLAHRQPWERPSHPLNVGRLWLDDDCGRVGPILCFSRLLDVPGVPGLSLHLYFCLSNYIRVEITRTLRTPGTEAGYPIRGLPSPQAPCGAP